MQEILHHQKDGWNPINNGILNVYHQLVQDFETIHIPSVFFKPRTSTVGAWSASPGPGQEPLTGSPQSRKRHSALMEELLEKMEAL